MKKPLRLQEHPSGTLYVVDADGDIVSLRSMVEEINAKSAVPEERKRVLLDSDPFCPKCGHNRDRSSVSSINNEDGTRSCQMCGTRWTEVSI